MLQEKSDVPWTFFSKTWSPSSPILRFRRCGRWMEDSVIGWEGVGYRYNAISSVSIAHILERAWESLGTISLHQGTREIWWHARYRFFFSVVNRMCCTQPIKILLRCQLFNLSPLFMKGQFFFPERLLWTDHPKWFSLKCPWLHS